jgi:hypothetical protein
MRVNDKVTIVWDVTPSSLVHGYRRFGGICCLHYQGTNRMALNVCKTTLPDIPEDQSDLKIEAASYSETLVPTYRLHVFSSQKVFHVSRNVPVLRYPIFAPSHLLPEFRPCEALVYKCGRPDEVIGFFSCPNSSRRTMALGSTQPLTEMSTRNLPGGKGRPAAPFLFKKACIYENGLGSAHPALCSIFL